MVPFHAPSLGFELPQLKQARVGCVCGVWGAGSEVPFSAPAAVQMTWGRSVDPNSNALSCCSWGPKLHAWGLLWAPHRYSVLWALPLTVPSTCPSAPHGYSLGCAHILLSTAARSSSHKYL